MFYCNDCAEKNVWPKTFFTSYGPCEICGKTADCNDTPSKHLPGQTSDIPKDLPNSRLNSAI